jgi:pimeloyl-ACP methyl ester carboxylesterase
MNLTLRADDPLVYAAKEAERKLYAHYHLAPAEDYIPIEALTLRVRVQQFGEGPPLLIVPGNTGDGFPFAPLIARLRGRRVILLNRPGGGLSEGFDHASLPFRQLAIVTLQAVLDYFQLAQVPIISHSMGSQWSLWFAMEHPEQVKRLCMLGVPGNVRGCRPPLLLRLAGKPRINERVFDQIAAKSSETSLRNLALMGHSQASISKQPTELAACYYHFQRLPHYKISSLSLLENTGKLQISRGELGQLQCPALLLWGENDTFGSVARGRAIANAMPRCDFQLIPQAGHLPWLDDSQICGKYVTQFLAEGGLSI